MSKIKKVLKLLGKGKFVEVFRLIYQGVAARIHEFFSAREDKKIGKIALTNKLPSKFADQGANATQSTDYKGLKHIFKKNTLDNNCIFVDVGCGEGRVLTYIYSLGFKGRIVGVELDPDVAETARTRTKECNNIEIKCSNILECKSLLAEADVYFLANPFKGKVMTAFLEAVETEAKKTVTIYYCYDFCKKAFQVRDNWSLIDSGEIKRHYAAPLSYSIWRYTPRK